KSGGRSAAPYRKGQVLHSVFAAASFLFWLLKGTNLKEQENATAQPVISGRKIYPIVLAIPPLAEQRRIVAKLNQLMVLCDQLKTRLTQARRLNEQLATALVEQAVA
ncbi:restriction endonuclease subunit S, partial [Stutzerimonas kunmingensis]